MENHARRMSAGWLAVAAAAVAACGGGSARRSEPLLGPLVATEASQERGKSVFMRQCYSCHPGGEAGLGPSLNDKRASARRVRSHWGGSPSRISDRELSDLLAYLAAMRRHSERLHEPLEAREASR